MNGKGEESEHFMMNAESVCGKVYQDLLPQSSGGGCNCGQGTRMFGVVLLQRVTRWPQIAVTGSLPRP